MVLFSLNITLFEKQILKWPKFHLKSRFNPDKKTKIL